MITVNELFSGIGTQSLAFKYLGIPHKVVGIAEIEKNAIKAYETLHGETRNYGDVSEIDKLDYADFWTYSFPCFTGETPVLTTKGYIPIKDIEVGMEVITHKNRVRKVVNWWETGLKRITEVTVGNEVLRTTRNHKFLVRIETRYGYGKAIWLPCEDIVEGDLVGISTHFTNNEKYPAECIIEDPYFYWVAVDKIDHR